jgi:hypothetical protein
MGGALTWGYMLSHRLPTHPFTLRTTDHSFGVGTLFPTTTAAIRNTRRNTRKAPPPQPIILPDAISYAQMRDNGLPTPPSISPPANGQGKGLINRFRRKNPTTPRGETGYATDGMYPC